MEAKGYTFAAQNRFYQLKRTNMIMKAPLWRLALLVSKIKGGRLQGRASLRVLLYFCIIFFIYKVFIRMGTF